jgi:MFS family permease
MTGTFARARAALHSADFRRLLGARLSSQLGDGIFQAFLVNELVFLSPEGQTTAVGVAKAFAILVIPFSLVGPLTGVVIDRWSRRRILIFTPLLRAAIALLLIPIAGGGQDFLLYAPALFVVSANRFYLATAGAVMPSLVPDEDLLVGNSLAGATGTVITFLGLVAGTQLAEPVGSIGLIVAAALTWPVGAALARRISRPLRAVAPGTKVGSDIRRVAGELVRGGRRLAATPAALGSIVSISIDQLLVGLMTVLSVVVFRDVFREGVASYGRIIAAGGVGVVVGTATVGWFESRMAKPRIVAVAFATAGICLLPASIHISGATIILVAFVLGLTFPWRKVPADTIVQEAVPDRYRGRVFALYDVAFSLPRVVAGLLGVVLIPHVSTGWFVALAAILYLIWSPVLPWWVRRPRWIRVRFYAGSRADEVPRALLIGADEEPVEVVASRLEDRAGLKVRTFRLRSSLDGTTLEVTEGPGERWRLTREGPRDVIAGDPHLTGPG